MANNTAETKLDNLFEAGAHYGFSKSRRHPSAEKFIFGSKNRVDIFDLEKTEDALKKAEEFVAGLASTNGVLLFVGGKNEAKEIVAAAAQKIGMPYVASRWIGGTLTNFPQIRKRVDTMLDLINQREKGELGKYTKKERLLIGRDIEKLQKMFGGIANMTNIPKALFIIDPRREETAMREALILGLPIIALCGTDNDFAKINYPIPGNDSNRKSIEYFVDRIKNAYDNNRTNKKA